MARAGLRALAAAPVRAVILFVSVLFVVEEAGKLPTDECEIFTAQLGGAAGRVASGAMAYAHRQTRYTMNIHGRWQKPSEDEHTIGWVRRLFNRSAPLSSGSVYINFVPEEEERRKIGPFGSNLSRLDRVPAGGVRAPVMA